VSNRLYNVIQELHKIPDVMIDINDDYESEMYTMLGNLLNTQNVYIIASTEQYNVGLVVKNLLLRYLRVRVDVIPITEFQFWFDDRIEHNSFVIFLAGNAMPSDILDTLRRVQKSECRIFTLTNHLVSTISNHSNYVLQIRNNESGVIDTQSVVLNLLFFMLVISKHTNGLVQIDVEKISDTIRGILSNHDMIDVIAVDMIDVSNTCVFGSGVHYPVALDLSYRLKMLAGVHAEGYATGEFKHGSLALIDDNMSCVAIHPNDVTWQTVYNTLSQIRSRSKNAKIVGITNKNNDMYSHCIQIPESTELESLIYEFVFSQLLSCSITMKKKRVL